MAPYHARMRAALGVLVLLLGGCAGLVATPDPGEGTLGGPGVPVQRPDRPIAAERRALTATLVVEPNGCLDAGLPSGRTFFVIWPAGTTMGETGDTVVVGARTLHDGDAFDGVGAIVPVLSLPDPTYWHEAHLAFCDPAATEVLVLDAAE